MVLLTSVNYKLRYYLNLLNKMKIKNKKQAKGFLIFIILITTLILGIFLIAGVKAQQSNLVMPPAPPFEQELPPEFFEQTLREPYIYPTAEVSPWMQVPWEDSYCNKTGMDFIIEISPDACSPAVVRSDLLEEQDVPVFCRMTGIKINPLIQVPYIKSITPRVEKRSHQIAYITFVPAKYALSYYASPEQKPGSFEGTPSMSNLGYLLINLKRQPVEAKMPDKVEAEISVKLKYDVAKTYGINENQFILPLLTQEEWLNNYKKYSFWRSKGYVRLKEITGPNTAKIAIYTNANSAPIIRELRVGVEPGKRDEIMLPGFYCGAGVTLRLDEISVPKTRVRLIVNGDELLLGEGDEIQDSDCYVVTINPSPYSYAGNVKIRCGSKEPKTLLIEDLEANLNIKEGAKPEYSKKVSIGTDLELFKKDSDKKNHIYVGFVGKEFAMGKEGLLGIVVLFRRPGGEPFAEKSKTKQKAIEIIYNYIKSKREITLSVMPEGTWKKEIKAEFLKYRELKDLDIYVLKKYTGKKEIGYSLLELVSVEGPVQVHYTKEIEAIYKEAIDQYKDIAYAYSTTYHDEGTYYGVKAYMDAADLAEYMYKKQDQVDLLQEMINKYSDSDEPQILNEIEEAREKLWQITAIGGNNIKTFQSQHGNYIIKLISIEKPSIYLQNAELEIDRERGTYGIGDIINDWEITQIDDVSISLVNTTNAKETIVVGEGKTLDGVRFNLITTHITQEVKVSVLPFERERETEVNFTLQIGIEKRAIQLSPDQTKDMIKKLDSTISTLEGITDKLGKVISVWNKACYIGATTLWIKNFVTGLSGESLARKKVMEHWTNKCSSKEYRERIGALSLSDCYRFKETAITADIDIMKQSISEANNFVKEIKKINGVTKSGGLFGLSKTIDEDKFMEVAQDDFPKELRNLEIKDEEGNILKSEHLIANLSLLHDKGYVFKNDVKDLYLQLSLYKKCKTKPGESALCSSILKGTYGELNYLSEDIKNIERSSAFSNQYGKHPAIIRPKERQVVKIPVYDIDDSVVTKFSNTKSKDKIRKYLHTGESCTYFWFNNKYYIAILDNRGGNTFTIKALYEIDESGEIIGDIIEEKELTTELTNMGISHIQKLDLTLCNNNEIIRGIEADEPRNTIKFWESGPYEGMVAYMPINLRIGWYLATTSYTGLEGPMIAFRETGDINTFWICNVGQDGIPNFDFSIGQEGDDCCTLVSAIQGIQPDIPPLNEAGARQVYDNVKRCAAEASQQYAQGKRKITTSRCGNFILGKPPTAKPIMQCEDFMSPTDCRILFNLCDPVVCPPSRCDYGGRMPVDNVVQSGVIGSLMLCWPNFEDGRGVLVPICLTGVNAGLESFTGILKSGRDCLEENLKTGKMVGICDQIMSVYICEFFWRQFDPFIRAGLPAISESLTSRGGGEYALFSETWKQSMDSVSYFTDYYGKTSIQAFKARSTTQIGTEICKKFISVSYPTQAKFWDELAKPESPTQATAWFDEIPLGGASTESHYKVFYYIWAGHDQGVYYSVYLTSPSTIGYYQAPDHYPIPKAFGYLPAGQYLSMSPDFRAPGGYKEICMRINNEEICGFGQATTNFAIEELQNLYIEDQTKKDVTTAKECISGKPTIMPTATLNLQSYLEQSLEPAIYKRGVIRVCSSLDPGRGTGEQNRWKRIGYCDNKDVGCWLDTKSIENAVSDIAISERIIEEADLKNLEYMMDELGYDPPEASKTRLDDLKRVMSSVEKSVKEFEEEVEALETIAQVESKENYFISEIKLIDEVITELVAECQDISEKCIRSNEKARAEWEIARLFNLRTKIYAKTEIFKFEKEHTCDKQGGEWMKECPSGYEDITETEEITDQRDYPGQKCCREKPKKEVWEEYEIIEPVAEAFDIWPSEYLFNIFDCEKRDFGQSFPNKEITIIGTKFMLDRRWDQKELKVKAVAEGKVFVYDIGEEKYVEINHGSFNTVYKDLADIWVRNGDVISMGRTVGLAKHDSRWYELPRAEFRFSIKTAQRTFEDPICFFKPSALEKVSSGQLCYRHNLKNYYTSQECIESRQRAGIEIIYIEEYFDKWPVNINPYNKLSSCYGYRTLSGKDYTDGIDISAPKGAAVYAIANGEVIKSINGCKKCNWNTKENCDCNGGFGNGVVIKHSENLFSGYHHLSSININKSDFVTKGQKIGEIGCTGKCTGDHLDLKIYTKRSDVWAPGAKGKHPLCFFSQEIKNKIEILPKAKSEFEKYIADNQKYGGCIPSDDYCNGIISLYKEKIPELPKRGEEYNTATNDFLQKYKEGFSALWDQVLPTDTIELMNRKIELQNALNELQQIFTQYPEAENDNQAKDWRDKINNKIEYANDRLTLLMFSDWIEFAGERAKELIEDGHKADCADFAIQVLGDFAENFCTNINREYELNIYNSTGNLVSGDTNRIRNRVGARGLLNDGNTVIPISVKRILIEQDATGNLSRIKPGSFNPHDLEPGDMLLFKWHEKADPAVGWDTLLFIENQEDIAEYRNQFIFRSIFGKGDFDSKTGRLFLVRYLKTVNLEITPEMTGGIIIDYVPEDWKNLISVQDRRIISSTTEFFNIVEREHGNYTKRVLGEDLYDIRRWKLGHVIKCVE